MTTPDSNEWNRAVMEEFRANGGKVKQFAGAPLLLLTTTGAKSGERRTTPLVYFPDGDRYLVFGSMGGAPKHPAWYRNLVAHPSATIEVGTEKVDVAAEVITGEERDRLFARQAAAMPNFAEYQAKTARVIPVIALSRKA